MDSVTQMVLGAAVVDATMGHKVGRRALAWGAVLGTLPDLDVFVPLGDAVRDFTYHRSASHSLFVLLLATPLLTWLILKIHPADRPHRRRWMLAVYLTFATHVLLDSLTAYGTQIFWPLSNMPVSISSIFIIDPAYTLPLLIGVVAALISRHAGMRWDPAGLALSSLYLCWTLTAKIVVEQRFEDALVAIDRGDARLFTTPAPFNTLLWRAVARVDGAYYEGYQSLLDEPGDIRFRRYPSDDRLLDGIEDHWPVQRLRWFSRGYYGVSRIGDDVVISDLRMGIEPDYVFRFKVGEIGNPHAHPAAPLQVPGRQDFGRLRSVFERIVDPAVELSP